ncbi:MAG: hypothetical protein EHM45_09655 [Desulfobacteraceae bacterium]|nr:MAG: hypothetical protein EHM45_09655 [Desulfobacteraceae bacterium]
MRKLKTAKILLVLVLVALAFATPARAEEQWHFQANLDVAKPGLMEAVLPAGLFFRTNAFDSASALDLALIGPDGNPRSLELYWKEELDARSLKLEPSRIYLDKKKGLVWEAVLPKNFQIENLQIDLIGPVGVGQVNVEVKDAQKWRLLIQNAALQNTGDGLTSEIKLEPAVYEQIRLCFQGFDKAFRKAVPQVRSVHIVGRNLAKDYVEKPIRLRFSDEKIGTERVLSTSLPGSGLWVEALVLTTDAQFQGTWQLGRQAVAGGKQEFQELLRGEVTAVNRAEKKLELVLQQSWPGRSLVLKLNPGNRYLGNIVELNLKVRLPRLVFLADKPGQYAAQSGMGRSAEIKETPGDPERRIEQSLVFAEVIENRQWRPENLAEKFAMSGGPFVEKGYRWRAKIRIPEAGFYRVVLDPETVLDADLPGLRLVKDGIQIPYFRGASEKQIKEFPITAVYDPKKNSSSWLIPLPESALQREVLEFETHGIFKRQVVFEIQQPGPTGWKSWREMDWQNRTNQPTSLSLGLEALPENIREIRMIIAHGDNQPIELSKMKLSYHAPALLFLSTKPGEYFLFGGNSQAGEPRYDLALVQAHLAEAVPKSVMMEKAEPIAVSLFDSGIKEYFSEKSWGLYAVLGLVTLVLMFLIVRLFPKERKPE